MSKRSREARIHLPGGRPSLASLELKETSRKPRAEQLEDISDIVESLRKLVSSALGPTARLPEKELAATSNLANRVGDLRGTLWDAVAADKTRRREEDTHGR